MTTTATTNTAASETIRAAIEGAISEIGDFVLTPAFQLLLQDLYARPEHERPQFVFDVVVNEEEWAKRGIDVPDGMIIQRSTFADGRPTLFCVTKYVPEAHPWEKVTITYDSR